jgi:hypothetical protein
VKVLSSEMFLHTEMLLDHAESFLQQLFLLGKVASVHLNRIVHVKVQTERVLSMRYG